MFAPIPIAMPITVAGRAVPRPASLPPAAAIFTAVPAAAPPARVPAFATPVTRPISPAGTVPVSVAGVALPVFAVVVAARLFV